VALAKTSVEAMAAWNAVEAYVEVSAATYTCGSSSIMTDSISGVAPAILAGC